MPQLRQTGAFRMRLCRQASGARNSAWPSVSRAAVRSGDGLEDCCHSRKHYRGAARFWAELGIEPIELASELWRVSGDVAAGRRTVMRARQTAMAAHQRRNRREPKRSLPRSALDRGAALRDQLRPIAMVRPPTSPELPLYWDSRS